MPKDLWSDYFYFPPKLGGYILFNVVRVPLVYLKTSAEFNDGKLEAAVQAMITEGLWRVLQPTRRHISLWGAVTAKTVKNKIKVSKSKRKVSNNKERSQKSKKGLKKETKVSKFNTVRSKKCSQWSQHFMSKSQNSHNGLKNLYKVKILTTVSKIHTRSKSS